MIDSICVLCILYGFTVCSIDVQLLHVRQDKSVIEVLYCLVLTSDTDCSMFGGAGKFCLANETAHSAHQELRQLFTKSRAVAKNIE